MHYEITFTKPNNIVVTGEQVQVYTRKGEVTKMLDDARRYPGSLQIVSVVKVSKGGAVRVHLPF